MDGLFPWRMMESTSCPGKFLIDYLFCLFNPLMQLIFWSLFLAAKTSYFVWLSFFYCSNRNSFNFTGRFYRIIDRPVVINDNWLYNFAWLTKFEIIGTKMMQNQERQNSLKAKQNILCTGIKWEVLFGENNDKRQDFLLKNKKTFR